jgi:hypothetical protein
MTPPSNDFKYLLISEYYATLTKILSDLDIGFYHTGLTHPVKMKGGK